MMEDPRKKLERLRREEYLQSLRDQADQLDAEDQGPPSSAEALWRGAAKGLTMGGIEKGAAGIEAGLGALNPEDNRTFDERYQESLEKYRKRYEAAQEAHPRLYGAAEFGGAVAPAFSPAGKLIPGGTLGKAAITGAGAAATQEALSSREENPETFARDVIGAGMIGAGGGAAGHTVIKGVPAAARAVGLPELYEKLGEKAKSGGKKLLSVLGGVRHENIEKYLKNPEAINAARVTPEIAEEVQSRISQLKDKVIQGSRESVAFLPNQKLPANLFDEVIFKVKSKFVNPTTGKPTALGASDNGRFAIEVIDRFYNDFSSQVENGFVNPRIIKRFIQNLDQITDYNGPAGSFNPVQNQAKKEMRQGIDSILKQAFPDYAQAMKKVEADTRALDEVSGFFGGSKDAAIAGLKTTGRNAARVEDQLARQGIEGQLTEAQQGARQKALNALSERTESAVPHGKDIVQEEANRDILNSFYADATRGSKGVLLGKSMAQAGGADFLGQLGSTATGIDELKALGTAGGIGAVLGGIRDAFGPQITKKVLDIYLKSNSADQTIIANASRVLSDAAARGPDALNLSLYLLYKQNPGLREIFEEQQ